MTARVLRGGVYGVNPSLTLPLIFIKHTNKFCRFINTLIQLRIKFLQNLIQIIIITALDTSPPPCTLSSSLTANVSSSSSSRPTDGERSGVKGNSPPHADGEPCCGGGGGLASAGDGGESPPAGTTAPAGSPRPWMTPTRAAAAAAWCAWCRRGSCLGAGRGGCARRCR
jgi:hypothetical protein